VERRFFDKASQEEEKEKKEEDDDDEEQRNERSKRWEHTAWEVCDSRVCALWDANKIDDLQRSASSKDLFRSLETS